MRGAAVAAVLALGAGAPAVPALAAEPARVDRNFEPRPYLAECWEISGDGLSYIFQLDPNARFHNGRPVASEDVAVSLAVVKEHHPFGIAMFGAVDRVDTPDPHTVAIRPVAALSMAEA